MNAGRLAQCYRLACVGVLHAHPGQSGAGRLDLDLRVQVSHILAHVALVDGKIRDAHLIPRLQPHRLPDAAGHKTRSPVPAVFIRRLADVCLVLGLRLQSEEIACCRLFSGLDRRWKYHAKQVFSGVQMTLHRHPPNAKHIVCIQHQGAVHIDLGGSVEPIENQLHVRPRQQSRSRVEVEPVLPALLLNPLQFGFVVAEKRVGNLLVGQQVQVNVAGNGSRQPAALDILRASRNLPELPAVIQG